jgi:NADH-quinone oxidoreductase subunit H
MFVIIALIKILIVVVPLLISVAYFTLAERKILGAIQRRRGPNVVGVYGLTQPLSDGFKLLVKETVLPSSSNKFIFIISPIITFVISLMGWAVIPFDQYATLAEVNIGVLYLFAISSLGVYGIIMSGWSSNSKYAFLGALRAAAQMISYDVSLGLILLSLIICSGSCNLTDIVLSQEHGWYIVAFWPLGFMFFVSSLAETNRAPFDLTEAEAELVAGYNVEYSGVGFTLFFLAEYSNMLLMSMYTAILFLGGWYAPFSFLSFISGKIFLALKTVLIVFMFIWTRASLPRFRYDQLMTLGWKVFLPISLIIFIASNIVFSIII